MKCIPSCSFFFFFSSRRRHTRCSRDWSSDVCSSDLGALYARSARTGADQPSEHRAYLQPGPAGRTSSLRDGIGGGNIARGSGASLDADAKRDRKSTRLNSSHGYISYAVFCLKKKNPLERVSIERKRPPCGQPCVLVVHPCRPPDRGNSSVTLLELRHFSPAPLNFTSHFGLLP